MRFPHITVLFCKCEMRIINNMRTFNSAVKRWQASLSHTLYQRDLAPCRPSDVRTGPGGRGAEAASQRPPRVVPLDVHLSAMRQSGMSQTAIRRALGLSEDQAVAHGLIPPRDMTPDVASVEPEPEEASPEASPRAGSSPKIDSRSKTKAKRPRRRRRREDDDPPIATDQPRIPTEDRRPGVPGPDMDEVLDAVARLSGVTREDLLGPQHNQHHVRRRHLAMYLMRELCPTGSLPAIGSCLRRDHSTVLHGCRRAADLLDRDAAFRELHDRVCAELAP